MICQEATGPLLSRLECAGWEVHQIGVAKSPLDLGWFLRGYRIAKQLRPTIIHGAVSEGNLLASFIGLSLSNRNVIIEETSDFRGRRWFGHLLFLVVAMRARVVVGVAPEIASRLRRMLGHNSRKVRLIVNGVSGHESPSVTRLESIRREYGIAQEDLVIGSSGRLVDSHKRFSDLIRILPDLSVVNKRIKVLIVGEGADRLRLESLSKDLGVANQVIFTGYQEHPRDFLELMDLFVLASSGEALSLALIEAMHAGLPIIASSVGGTPYALGYGETGRLYPAGDLTQLRVTVSDLLSSNPGRERLGKSARVRAQNMFGESRYIRQVGELWNGMLPE